MRVAFYAPLKPPDHPVPSGDRLLAGLFQSALRRAGHEVELACRLRSRDPLGDPLRQARLRALGARLAERYAARCLARPASQRPALWFTYHLYYKAPDWIGPSAARRLGIPYVAAEASVANKRAGGTWAAGHEATLAALDQAAAVIALNPADLPGLPQVRRLHSLAPFADLAPFRAAAAERGRHRAALAAACGLDPGRPWLLAVAMMRPGDKLASYRGLAEALGGLTDLEWQLVIVGDGAARAEVEAAFAALPRDRLRYLGERPAAALPAIFAAADLYAWPAVNEAFGMALLEAQGSGLPVVAGRYGGVAAVVAEGRGGLLTPPGDLEAFAAALRALIGDPERRAALRAGAGATAAGHDLDAAAGALDAILRQARIDFVAAES
ncbi:MAG: glycosyltransferase family 4 protein [Kiloniellales bacterium]|nr:glycosyltransferase family 4 protein [Kiloniellales bacterium]